MLLSLTSISKDISSFFRRYQQEDAHEFLQCLLDRLDSNWSKYEASADVSTLPVDTLVQQIFGGRLVSQVAIEFGLFGCLPLLPLLVTEP